MKKQLFILSLCALGAVSACKKEETFILSQTEVPAPQFGDMHAEPYFIYNNKFIDTVNADIDLWQLEEERHYTYCDSTFYNRWVCGQSSQMYLAPAHSGNLRLFLGWSEEFCPVGQFKAGARRFFEPAHYSDSISRLEIVLDSLEIYRVGDGRIEIVVNWNGLNIQLGLKDGASEVPPGDVIIVWQRDSEGFKFEVTHRGSSVHPLSFGANFTTSKQLDISLSAGLVYNASAKVHDVRLACRGISIKAWK